MKAELYCIIGVDGVGKTTHANKLVGFLRKNGIRSRYAWFRFYHFLSIFLLIYCRMAGFTVYEIKNGQKIGRHEFYRSKLISYIYPILLFIDIIPIYFIKIFLPMRFGVTVVCDRFVYDTLVDLMIDLKDFEIHKKFRGKLFKMLIPENIKVVHLDLNESIIRERRIDLEWDQSLETRRKAYHRISKDFNLSIIDNDGKINDVHEKVIESLEVIL